MIQNPLILSMNPKSIQFFLFYLMFLWQTIVRGNPMIVRPERMDKISIFMDQPLVKILVGVRGCGKSTLLDMVKNELISHGIREDHILMRDYRKSRFHQGITARKIYDELSSMMRDKGRYYLLIDGLEWIEGWEKAILTLFERNHADIYLTGSDDRMMPDRISTYLTGRYILIPVYPLSYREYLLFREGSVKEMDTLLSDYVLYGGFPSVHLKAPDLESTRLTANGIYRTILSDEIMRHHRIDCFRYQRVMEYVIDHLGKTLSKDKEKEIPEISTKSLRRYLGLLEESFIVYSCPFYDIQRKSVMRGRKYYLSDVSFRYVVSDCEPKISDGILKNIVFLELRRRGYNVFIGKNKAKEIGLVATRFEKKLYVQVREKLPFDSDREVESLMKIRDHYPKYVVTMNHLATGNENGIQIVHLSDFLLSDQF